MKGMNQGSLAVLALTNRLIEAGVAPLTASEVWRVLGRVDDPARLLGSDERAAADLTSGTGIEAARLVRLLDAGVALAARLDSLTDQGISAITALDEHFPDRLRERLGTAAPPVLYCAGELSLLGRDGIGVVGSRDVGPEAVEATRKVALLVAAAGLALVSGAAKGVDRISMSAAYEAGGGVVGVLADSLERAVGQADNRRAMLDGRACLCTPYRPDSGFTTGNAMGRNKIVYGLSRATLVVASAKGEGGTWSGATEAIRKRYGRVAVWTGAGGGPGNDALVTAGGAPVAQPESILELEAIAPATDASPGQIAFGFEPSG
ncbi:MAG: DNA-processing protein DprA [Acidimicrobiales bacterium]